MIDLNVVNNSSSYGLVRTSGCIYLVRAVVTLFYTSKEIGEGYIFIAVCVSVCMCVCLSVSEQNSSRTDAPI